MFHPARIREKLAEFFLRHAADFSCLVEQDTPVARCPRIQCHYILCHGYPSHTFRWSYYTIFLRRFVIFCFLWMGFQFMIFIKDPADISSAGSSRFFLFFFVILKADNRPEYVPPRYNCRSLPPLPHCISSHAAVCPCCRIKDTARCLRYVYAMRSVSDDPAE